jgi:hypothetical protein
MGDDGLSDDEDGYEDGSRDDGGMAGKPLPHCKCCPNYGYAPGTAPSKSFPTTAQATASSKFACPYFKHNPERYSKCGEKKFPQVYRIK